MKDKDNLEILDDLNLFLKILPSKITNHIEVGDNAKIGIGAVIIKNVPKNVKKMIAGNIQIQDLEKISKITDIVDCSGMLETNKKKDLTKIKKFLLKVKEINEN